MFPLIFEEEVEGGQDGGTTTPQSASTLVASNDRHDTQRREKNITSSPTPTPSSSATKVLVPMSRKRAVRSMSPSTPNNDNGNVTLLSLSKVYPLLPRHIHCYMVSP
jgi:hypothetical protein